MMKKTYVLFILGLFLSVQLSAQAGIALTKTSASMEENFDGMGEGLDLPTGWRVEANSSGPRIVGPYATALTSVHFTGGPSLSATQKNGTYNFYDSQTTTDRAVGGISTNASSGNNTRGTNVYLHLQNADQEAIRSLTFSYDVEKYREGSNAAGFSVQLYYSVDGSEWISAGDDFRVSFNPDGQTAGAANVPIVIQNVTKKPLDVSVAVGGDIYLAWNISASSGNNCASAMALALDNVTVSAEFGNVDTQKTTRLMPEQVVLVPQAPEQVRLVSMNNSLIQRNEQWTIFNRMAATMGKDATWTAHTMLGQTLMTHYESDDAKPLIASTAWSHVILQEQSSLPRTDINTFKENVKVWVDYIRGNCPNPDAVILLPVNWAYNENGWADFTAQNTALVQSYTQVAQELGVTITPVALAYQKIFDDKGAEYMETMYTDNRHPSAKATYLAACMEYAIIFGVAPTSITYTPRNLTAEEADMLRVYAKQALDEYENIVDHHKGRVNYVAAVFDQYLNTITSATPFSYTTDGGGRMEGNVFVANGTAGTYTITVTRDADETAQAFVKVAEKPSTTSIPIKMFESSNQRRNICYNLAGLPITNPVKGVYIINSKKLVIQ